MTPPPMPHEGFGRSLTLVLLPSAMACIGIIAVLTILVVPTIRAIRTVNEAIVAEYATLEQRYRAGGDLVRALRVYDRVAPEVDRLRSAFVQTPDALAFVEAFEALGRREGVEVRITLEESRTAGAGVTRTVPMVIELTGAYPSILRALRELERGEVAIAISELTVTTGEAQPLAAASVTGRRRAPVMSPVPPIPRVVVRLRAAAETFWTGAATSMP